MTQQTDPLPERCYCSVVSKENGEDPIGSIAHCNHYLIVEVPTPWPRDVTNLKRIPTELIALLQALILEQGLKIRPLIIVPDEEYSVSDKVRVFHYYRPENAFSIYQKEEFLVSEAELFPLVQTIFSRPAELPRFAAYQQHTSHIRELFVCTHGSVDAACAVFGYPMYRKLRDEYADPSGGTLRAWRVSHFGGHRFAPTLIDLPEGRFWGHLETDQLDTLIHRTDSVESLRLCYRGWTGLESRYEHVAERDMLMQEGWDWMQYAKHGQLLEVDTETEQWGRIRIDFTTPNGRSGAYEAMVERSGTVQTLGESGPCELREEPQYRVNWLRRV
ncbi:MAG: sucrase ferredoxin [Chloroflexota bacterium]